MYIQFFPTFRCNESCAFCFNRGVSARSYIEVADFSRLTDILAGEGIKEIDILGGEPTLHPELITLIDITCAKGLSVSMSTNGSNVLALKNLSDNFDRSRLQIGISINYKAVDETLSSYISKHKPLLKSVCTKRHFLPDSIMRFLGMPGSRHYAIFLDTLNIADLEQGLSFPQYYRTLKDVRDKYGNVEGLFCSGFIPDIKNYPMLEGVRCPAGTTKLSIMPDGSVYPCYLFFGCPEFRLGNILSNNLKDILNNPLLNFFRRFEKNNCPDSTCEHFSLCHGGCPAVSLMINGDLDAPDPRCIG